MALEHTILTDYMQVAGTYASRSILEGNGFVPLDENRYYYGRVRDGALVIWRTIGDCRPDEDRICTPIFGTQAWAPDNEYTGPLNKKIAELYKN